MSWAIDRTMSSDGKTTKSSETLQRGSVRLRITDERFGMILVDRYRHTQLDSAYHVGIIENFRQQPQNNKYRRALHGISRKGYHNRWYRTKEEHPNRETV